jgi:hypothetical protein
MLKNVKIFLSISLKNVKIFLSISLKNVKIFLKNEIISLQWQLKSLVGLPNNLPFVLMMFAE